MKDGLKTGELIVDSVSGTDVQATIISGTNIGVGGSLTDPLGRFLPIGAGSPPTYGLTILVGSATTAGGSGVFLSPGADMPSQNYYVYITPRSFSGTTSVAPYSSGTKNISGVNMIGAASSGYDYAFIGN